MKPMEDQLREALRRKEPPAGFAERVAALAAESSAASPKTASPKVTSIVRPRRSWRMPFAIAASLALVLLGNQQYREYQGEQAKQQVMLALQITSEKISVVERKIADLNRRVENDTQDYQ